jgi:hypothetical protein
MKTHPLQDRIITHFEKQEIHRVATGKILSRLIKVASVHIHAYGVYVQPSVGTQTCEIVCVYKLFPKDSFVKYTTPC